jgi:arylsulfatase A-like enzyme
VFDGKDLVAQVRTGASTPERQLVWRSSPLRTVRQGDWKYHRDFDGNEFLYNLRTDPKERVNLAKQEAQRLAELQAVYAQWERDKKAPAWPGRFTEYDFDGRHFKFAP